MAYTPTTWATGDKISSVKMNKLEQGVADAQPALVSGTNIKTINNQSLLGSGNIEIGGAVDSVNGQTGTVVLDAADIGAASETALARTNDMLDVLYKLTKGQAWDILADNTTAYQKTLPAGTHLSVLNGWGGNTVEDAGETIHADVQEVVIHGRNLAKFDTEYTPQTSTAVIESYTEEHIKATIDSGAIFVARYTMNVISGESYKLHSLNLASDVGVYIYGDDLWGSDLIASDRIRPTAPMTFTSTKTGKIVIGIYLTPTLPVDMYGMVALKSTESVPSAFIKYSEKSLSIPAAVRALTGYGWSAGSVANTVEYDAGAKKWHYYQRVGVVDLGSLTWYKRDSQNFHATIQGKRSATVANVPSNLACSKYTTGDVKWISFDTGDNVIMEVISTGFEKDVLVIDKSHANDDANTFKTAVSGVMLYYQLATQVDSDITDLMDGFDNYLNEVEPGGTLTFVNSNSIAVPSQIDNYRNLSEVTP